MGGVTIVVITRLALLDFELYRLWWRQRIDKKEEEAHIPIDR